MTNTDSSLVWSPLLPPGAVFHRPSSKEYFEWLKKQGVPLLAYTCGCGCDVSVHFHLSEKKGDKLDGKVAVVINIFEDDKFEKLLIPIVVIESKAQLKDYLLRRKPFPNSAPMHVKPWDHLFEKQLRRAWSMRFKL